MAIKVYVDVLFLTNLIFDYILLCFTALFSKTFAKPLKMLLSSAFGALFAVVSFFTLNNAGIVTATQLAVSVAMIMLAFGVADFFKIFRLCAVFFVCTFTLGGACLALTKESGGAILGGAVYLNVSAAKLLTAGTLTYVLSNISYGAVLSKRAKAAGCYTVKVCKKNKAVSLKGFYDTGNTAKDENGNGFIIAKKNSVFPLIDGDSLENFGTASLSTLGGSATLKTFTPDAVYFGSKEKKCKIAVCDDEINFEADAILPNDFFDYF